MQQKCELLPKEANKCHPDIQNKILTKQNRENCKKAHFQLKKWNKTNTMTEGLETKRLKSFNHVKHERKHTVQNGNN
jgi:hypothetical protein